MTCSKRLVSPVGELRKPYAITCQAAERPKLFKLNRYPRQVIGFTIRLPRGWSASGTPENYYLSIVWAKPARWWA